MFPLQINFAQFGVIEDNGQVWANAQMVTDFIDEPTRAGCSFGTIPVSTDNNCEVAKRLRFDLIKANGPINIIATMGTRSSKGKITTIIKDYKLVEDNKASPTPVAPKSIDTRSASI